MEEDRIIVSAFRGDFAEADDAIEMPAPFQQQTSIIATFRHRRWQCERQSRLTPQASLSRTRLWRGVTVNGAMVVCVTVYDAMVVRRYCLRRDGDAALMSRMRS